MIDPAPDHLVAEYRATIEQALELLTQIAGLSAEQRVATTTGNYEAFAAASQRREDIMTRLTALDGQIRERRTALMAVPALVSHRGFADADVRRQEAAATVTAILAGDQGSLEAMANAALARRSAVASLERSGSTLAAYRRVLAPPVSTSALLDRVG